MASWGPVHSTLLRLDASPGGCAAGRIIQSKALRNAQGFQIADKEGKNVVFPSLWLAGENQ